MNALSFLDLCVLSLVKKISRFTNSWFGADNFFLANAFIFLSVILMQLSVTIEGINPYNLIWMVPANLFFFYLFSTKIDLIKKYGSNELIISAVRKGLLMGNILAEIIFIVKYTIMKSPLKDLNVSLIVHIAMCSLTLAHYFMSYHDDPPKETWLSKQLQKMSEKRHRLSSTQ